MPRVCGIASPHHFCSLSGKADLGELALEGLEDAQLLDVGGTAVTSHINPCRVLPLVVEDAQLRNNISAV